MPKSILFWPDVYKEQGHWLPTLKWAQDLHDNVINDEHPYSVRYMGISDCEPIITQYDVGDGVRFGWNTILQNMYPLGYTTASHSTPNERWKPWHIWAILYSQFSDKSAVVSAGGTVPNEKLWDDAQSIRTAWNTALPNLLVSGFFTSLETLLFYWIYKHRAGRSDLDFVITTTYLRHPQDDPAVRAMQNLQAFSKPELFKIINMATKGEISTEEPELTVEEFVQPLETFNELIPCPREFDYDHYKHGELVHYVEPCITKELIHTTISRDSDGGVIPWHDIKDAQGEVVTHGIIDSQSKIIFVTAGSQVLDYEDKAKNLFHSMCKAMQSPQMKDCFLVVAAGSSLVNSEEWKDYDKSRVLIANWVPQRELLASGKVKCALIHGGLATIKECVYYNCNFVIHPMGKDQVDNALRLKHCGINNMLPMSNVCAETLLNAINRVTSDYLMKAKLKKMSDLFQEMEQSDPPEVTPPGTALLCGILENQGTGGV